MKKRLSVILFITFSLFAHIGFSQAKVYFIPTLHGLHKVNQNYNYDSLKNTIARLNPDVIAVEIRPEDINADTGYLSKNYPYEMWMMKNWFPGKIIAGFDWVGNEFKGKELPADYWKEISPIKKFEKALDDDSIVNLKRKECVRFTEERLKLLKSLALKELITSKDYELTNLFYLCLSYAVNGSIHKRVTNFYNERNEEILKSINRIIKKNKDKTIVVITGDDHYIALKNRFVYLDPL